MIGLATALAALAAVPGPGTVERAVTLDFVAEDVAVTSSGRVLVLGQQYKWYLAHVDARVHALTPDGRVDRSFGEHGIAPLPSAPDDSGGGGRLLIQPDGRLLVAELWNANYASGNRRPALRRLNADGSPDTTFGAEGAVIPNLGTPSGIINAVALQPDGGIVVGGSTDHNSAPSVTVARHLPSGAPDLAFGEDGRVTLAAPVPVREVELGTLPDGALVVVASSASGSWYARLGGPGEGGAQLEPLRLEHEGAAARFVVSAPPVTLPGGGVRVPGHVQLAREDGRRMAVVGLHEGGGPDVAYGHDGLALGPRPKSRQAASASESVSGAAVDTAGGLVLGGMDRSNNYGDDGRSFTSRLEPDGRPDRSYGRLGRAHLDSRSFYNVGLHRIAARPDGGVVSTVSAVNGKYGSGGPSNLRWLRAGPDADAPVISVRPGCRRIRVRVVDATPVQIVVRAGGRRIRRTGRTRFSLRRPDRARRVVVEARDVAGNRSVRRARLPRC